MSVKQRRVLFWFCLFGLYFGQQFSIKVIPSPASQVRWTIELMRLHNHNLSHCAWWAPLSPSAGPMCSPIQMTGPQPRVRGGVIHIPPRDQISSPPLAHLEDLRHEAMVWSRPSLLPSSHLPSVECGHNGTLPLGAQQHGAALHLETWKTGTKPQPRPGLIRSLFIWLFVPIMGLIDSGSGV